ncbi:hypothetical protein [Streptomyces sp. NPDC007264]|uniref:hypothetical protein n=1 Tax=Streptomyces sp. NPDC007264 TaxID=3364777 RepID=UPI0036DCCD2C
MVGRGPLPGLLCLFGGDRLAGEEGVPQLAGPVLGIGGAAQGDRGVDGAAVAAADAGSGEVADVFEVGDNDLDGAPVMPIEVATSRSRISGLARGAAGPLPGR